MNARKLIEKNNLHHPLQYKSRQKCCFSVLPKTKINHIIEL